MFHSFSHFLITKIIDWLIVLLAVSFILWFAFTLPVFQITTITAGLPNISEARLKSTVKTLVETYNPRTPQYDNLSFTTDYLYKELSKLGLVIKQPFSAMERMGKKHHNLILNLGPDTNEVFVIGAHYDAETDSLNAEGNASGMASLLELAHHLSTNKEKLAISVQLVAYPISKIPLNNFSGLRTTGSFFHAQSLKKAGIKVKMMLSLDSVGHYNVEANSQKYPYEFMHVFYPDQGDYISVIGQLGEFTALRHLKKSFVRSSSLPIVTFNLPEIFSPTSSLDHLNYQQQGFRSVLITDTAKYRQAKGQQKTLERLDYKKIGALVTGLYQVVMDNQSAVRDIRLVQSNQVSGK